MLSGFDTQFNQLHNLNGLTGRHRVFARAVQRIADSRVISRIVSRKRQPGFLYLLFTFHARQYAITHVVPPVFLRQTLAVFQSVFLRI